MKKVKSAHIGSVALLASLFVLIGCAPDVGVQMQVSPESLDFGRTETTQDLYVAKLYTSGTMEALVVDSDSPWIIPETCREVSEDCISRGPADKIKVPIRIDRNKLAFGVNVGTVYIHSGALSPLTVPVTAEELAQADFRVEPERVALGQPIKFYDMSVAGESSGDIKFWNWSFGDGAKSTSQNPEHTYNVPGTFTVALAIETTAGIKRRVEKTNCVFVEATDTRVDFHASKQNIILGETILFTDLSITDNLPVLSRNWNFGDGSSSSATAPYHEYAASGIYTVTLSLTTAGGTYSATKEDYIVVRGKSTARADFEFENAYVDEDAQFFPIIFESTGSQSFAWDFGDGETSVEESPRHRFPDKGIYLVELLFTDDYGSVSLQKSVEVRYRPPQVLFTADPTRQARGKPIEFSERTIEGYGSVVDFKWDFGDGHTSTKRNPSHTYEFLGVYDVTLEVTSVPDVQLARLTKKNYITIVDEEAFEGELELDLADYVRLPDSCFTPEPDYKKENIRVSGQRVGTAYLIDEMVSQCWNPDDAVYTGYEEWVHPVTIIVPSIKMSDTAMLFIDGGSRSSTAEIEQALRDVAILSGTTLVHIKNVPSQPIVFNDEVIAAGEEDNYSGEPKILRKRSEDAIIAYSYDKYLRSYRDTDGKPTSGWPALYPMVNSAVRAMDVAETLLAKDGVQINGFVVAGASKRGWTTWLTGAVDSRIKGIAPIVINVLNMKPHLEHHRASYGYWSPAIYDYAQKGIFDQLISTVDGEEISEEAQSLLERVDPYQYVLKGRYEDMPKFMMNATGDEFFVPDTTQFYFDRLPDVKHLNYLPNVGHGMGDWDESESIMDAAPVRNLLAWYLAVSQNVELPRFDQTFEENGAIRVEIDEGNPPEVVRLWQVTSVGKRDFRNGVLDAEWTSTELEEESAGIYRALPPEPAAGNYTGFFVQLEYPNPANLPSLAEMYGLTTPNLVFTTGVRVLPVDDIGNPVYPEFAGYLANDIRPDAVPFDDTVMPVITLYGTPLEMGRDYGILLSDDISAFVPAFLDQYKDSTGADDDDLTAQWDTAQATLDPRLLDEIEGIAEGAGIDLTLLQLAHAAALYNGTWNSSATMAYDGLFTDDVNAAHTVTINNTEPGLELADYLCAVVYIPNKGAPHTVLTYAGLAFGYTGINLGAISASEIPYTDVVSISNTQPLMREVFYDAFSLRDAIALVEADPPLNTALLFGDGRNEYRGARIRTDALGIVPPIRYDLAEDDFERSIPGIVYESQALLLPTLQDALSTFIDDLTLEALRNIANSPSFATDGANLLNVVFDSEILDIHVNKADAAGNTDAFETYDPETPQTFNMQLLLP